MWCNIYEPEKGRESDQNLGCCIYGQKRKQRKTVTSDYIRLALQVKLQSLLAFRQVYCSKFER